MKELKNTQHFTNGELLEKLIKHVVTRPKSISILEPSCGDGAIIDKLIKHGYENITAYELDKKFYEICVEKYKHIETIQIINDDFLFPRETTKQFDYCVGNPPFSFKISELYGDEYQKRIRKELKLFTLADICSIFIAKINDVCDEWSLVTPKNINKGNSRVNALQPAVEKGFNIYDHNLATWECTEANLHVRVIHASKLIKSNNRPIRYNSKEFENYTLKRPADGKVFLDELEKIGQDFYEKRQELLKTATKKAGKQVGVTKLYNCLKEDNSSDFIYFDKKDIEMMREKQFVIDKKVIELYAFFHPELKICYLGTAYGFADVLRLLPRMNQKNGVFDKVVFLILHKLNALYHHKEIRT